MPASTSNPVASAVAAIDRRSSDHPAYWPLFARYRDTGQSATRALALLAEEWDEEILGPLPSERTARHWAQVDAWDDTIRDAVDASWVQYHRHVGAQLKTSAPLAVRTLEQVMSGEYPEPKMASAAVRAALAVLDVVGFRKDSLAPEGTEAEYSRYLRETIGKMTPEELLQLEAAELAAEGRADAAPASGNGGNGSVASVLKTNSEDTLS
jgi:hypothetical protein